MNSKEDKILIKGCILGEPLAQRQLYDRYANEMFKICRSYAPDYDTAHDFLQEGFIKVFEKIHSYSFKGRIGGWIRRVMIYNCIDMIRKDHYNKHKVSLDFSYSHNEPTIEDSGQLQINTDSFFKILEDLPVGYRTVLNLYYCENYTHKEIANTLSITEGTSKSQLYKAKNYLEKILIRQMSHKEIEFYVGRLVKKMV